MLRDQSELWAMKPYQAFLVDVHRPIRRNCIGPFFLSIRLKAPLLLFVYEGGLPIGVGLKHVHQAIDFFRAAPPRPK